MSFIAVLQQDLQTSLFFDASRVCSFTFQAPCDQPTVYAIHGIDAEMQAGVSGAGILAEFNHCGEVCRLAWRIR